MERSKTPRMTKILKIASNSGNTISLCIGIGCMCHSVPMKNCVSFLFMMLIKASQRRVIIHQVSSAQVAAAADGMCYMLEAVANSFPSFHNI